MLLTAQLPLMAQCSNTVESVEPLVLHQRRSKGENVTRELMGAESQSLCILAVTTEQSGDLPGLLGRAGVTCVGPLQAAPMQKRVLPASLALSAACKRH